MPFACIYVPDFPVAAVLRVEPELSARAVTVLDGKPPLERVFAVNKKAGARGIVPDMTKAQAEICGGLALRQRSALQESAAHAALLDCAQSFSPCVEDAARDAALVDVAGLEALFGPPAKIARSMYHRAASLGLEVNVAVAPNPDAAVLAARGFSGVTVIPSGKEAGQLGPLPVDVLFADWLHRDQKQESIRLLETLHRWGIRNLRALAALPAIALSERLGQEGLRLQQLARGAASRTLVPMEPPLVFEEAVELEYPIVLLEPLAFLLNRLLEQLCTRLAARTLATQELRLSLELESRPGSDFEFVNDGEAQNDTIQSESKGRQKTFCRTIRLPVPMLDARLFLKLLQLDLNAHPPGAPIAKIHLAAEPAQSRSAQGGLFLPPTPEPEKLELTLARISGIVGENKFGSLSLLDTHRPEGFRMRRFVAETAREARSGRPASGSEMQSVPKNDNSTLTALRIFRPPLRATVTLQSGQPERVVCVKKKEVQGNVLWKAGPWRASGDWWEREAWARDEWDIALQNGDAVVLYRLVHDLLGGAWFVEGTYD